MNQQCKVCGEPAAGFHFGAFTCEGCKSFFGRTYNNMGAISECKNNRECVIDKKNRTSCKACRLRKCLLVGMSKSGSRYGRRSNWFKIHCLLQEQSNNQSSHSGLNSTAALLGSAMYPGGAFLPGHLFAAEKLLVEQSLNGFHSDYKRRKLENGHQSSASSEDASSLAGDLEDDCSSRPASALSYLRPPSSHQSPSPFSAVTLTNSPPGPLLSQPAGRLLFPGLPSLLPVPSAGWMAATKPGLAPTSRNTGGDLLQYSPTLGGVAVEQDRPIDLSVRPTTLLLPAVERNHRLAGSKHLLDSSEHEDDKDDTSEDEYTRSSQVRLKHSTTPLDLTSKRPTEVPQSG